MFIPDYCGWFQTFPNEFLELKRKGLFWKIQKIGQNWVTRRNSDFRSKFTHWLNPKILKNLNFREILAPYTVWPKYDGTSTERNSYELMWIFHLRCHHILVRLYLSFQSCPENRNFDTYRPRMFEKLQK